MKVWWIQILRHARPPWRSLAGTSLLLLLGSLLTALTPWPIKLLMDCILKPVPQQKEAFDWLRSLPGATSDMGVVAWLVIAGPVIFIAARLVQMVQGYIMTGLGSRLTYHLGAELLDRLQELSLIFHSRQRVGDLVRRVTTDSGCARDLVCAVIIPGASAVLGLVMMFLFMVRLDPVLALVAVSFAIPLILLIRWFARPMADRAYEQQELSGQMMAHAEQTLGAVSLVQSFGREAAQDRQYSDLCDQTLRAYLRSLISQLQFKMGTGGVMALGSATILLFGGAKVIRGEMTVGDLTVFAAYVTQLYAPLETLAYLGSGFATASAGARRVLDVLESVERVEEHADARPLQVSSDVRGLPIRLDHVTFGYRTAEPVLHAIELEIPAGQVVALVGPTGAGKSTLASLVPRLFDPWGGRVRMGEDDVRELTLTSLRRQIAVVPQEPLLLPLSVARNIAYGRPDAAEDAVRQAAEAAGAAEFIERLPNGYDTILGERGATLSVGQRQRLAIARAILKDARVLILDEPTSALDTTTEREVVTALDRLMHGRTCLIIAHRLSSIRHADRILVLEGGRIVQDGSPSELARQHGLYQHLLQLQGGHVPPLAEVRA